MHANTYKETSLRISNSCFNGDPPKPMMGPKEGAYYYNTSNV